MDPIALIRKAIQRAFFSNQSNGPAPAAAPEHTNFGLAKLLCVLPSAADCHLMTELSRRQHWDMYVAASRDQAHRAIQQVQPHVVLLDRDVEPAGWRYALSSLAQASNGACVLLVSPVIDEYLWNDVVLNGGYDVLRKPLSEDDVSRNVKLALSYWNATHRPSVPLAK